MARGARYGVWYTDERGTVGAWGNYSNLKRAISTADTLARKAAKGEETATDIVVWDFRDDETDEPVYRPTI